MPIIGGGIVSEQKAQEREEKFRRFQQQLKLYKTMPPEARKEFLVKKMGMSELAEVSPEEAALKFDEIYAKKADAPGPDLTANPMWMISGTDPVSPGTAATRLGLGTAGAAATAFLPGPFKGAGMSLLASAPFTSPDSAPADVASAAVNAIPAGRGGFIMQTLKNMFLGGAEGVARKAFGDEQASPALQAGLGAASGLAQGTVPWMARAIPGKGREMAEDILFQSRSKLKPAGEKAIPQKEAVRMLTQRPEYMAQVDQALGQPGLAASTAAPASLVPEDVLKYMRSLEETAKGSVQVAPLPKRPTIKPFKETPTYNRGVSPLAKGTEDEVVEEFIGGGRITLEPGTASVSRQSLGVGFNPDLMYTRLLGQITQNKKYAVEAQAALQALDYMNDAVFGDAKGADAVLEVANKHKLFSNVKNFPSRASIDAAAEDLAEASNFDKTSAVAVLEHAVKYGRGEGTLKKLVDKVGKETDQGIRALIDETKMPGETVETVIPGQAPKFDLADNTAYEMRVAPMRQQAAQRTEEANAKIAAENAFKQEQAQVANARNIAQFKQKLEKFDAIRQTRESLGLPGILPKGDELAKPITSGGDSQDIVHSLGKLFETVEKEIPKDLPRTRQLMIQQMLAKVRDAKLTKDMVKRLKPPDGIGVLPDDQIDPKTAGLSWEYLKTLTGETEVPDSQATAALGLSAVLRDEQLLNAIAQGDRETVWLSTKLSIIGVRFRELLKADPSGAVERYMKATPEQIKAMGTRLNTTLPMLRSGMRVGVGEISRSTEGEGQRQTILDTVAKKFKGAKNRQKIVDRLP
jgi:hypothetical protein